jgi:hypothetical protein
MNFGDAVRMSISRYLEGRLELGETSGVAGGELKYSLEFFDELEESMIEDNPKIADRKPKEEVEDED